MPVFELSILDATFAMCRLARDASVPEWAMRGDVFAIIRSLESLSILCPEDRVPTGVECTRGWHALRLDGQFDFDESGVLAAIANPLGAAQVPTLVVSAYETDYFLVKGEDLTRAQQCLAAAGHRVSPGA